MTSLSNSCNCFSSCIRSLYSCLENYFSADPTVTVKPAKAAIDSSFWRAIEESNRHWSAASEEEWNSFMRQTASRKEPAEALGFVLEHLNLQPRVALDLGCGTGSDTLYLLSKGWKVIALDSNQLALTILANRVEQECPAYKDNLTLVHSSLEDYAFDQRVNLINATQTLPFCNPLRFQEVWKKLVDAIEPEGVFNGQFYDFPRSFLQFSSSVMYIDYEQVEQLIKQDFEEPLFAVDHLDHLTISAAGKRKSTDSAVQVATNKKFSPLKQD